MTSSIANIEDEIYALRLDAMLSAFEYGLQVKAATTPSC